MVSLFIFVLCVFLLAVWQTGLAGERGDLQEKVMIAVNAQGHQEGSDSVKQVSCQHGPESIVRNTERSSGAGMQEAPDVGPLTLEEEEEEDGGMCCHAAMLSACRVYTVPSRSYLDEGSSGEDGPVRHPRASRCEEPVNKSPQQR